MSKDKKNINLPNCLQLLYSILLNSKNNIFLNKNTQ